MKFFITWFPHLKLVASSGSSLSVIKLFILTDIFNTDLAEIERLAVRRSSKIYVLEF